MTKEKNLANELWNEIKELPIEMFSLPNQRVKDHVKRKGGTPDSVVLALKSPATLPSLEATLVAQKQYREKVSNAQRGGQGELVTETFPKYDMEEADGGYVVVRRHVPTPDRPEYQDLAPVYIADKQE